MKLEPVAGVQPEVFIWARKTVGLSISDVALKLKRTDKEIESWESGKDAPSYAQLEKLAYEIYKRPLAIFFLPAPPDEVTPQREFRTLPDSDLQTLLPDTYMQIRRAHAYQIALKEMYDNHNPNEKCIWNSLPLSFSDAVIEQAAKIRKYLDISIDNQITWKDDEIALKKWRHAIEEAGIFVFKAAFRQKEISGFCLMDKNLPIIYLNNSTTKTRQIFSLLHELAHLLLSVNGLSKFDKTYIDHLPKAEQKIERFCNAIAAEVLIPNSDFLQQTRILPTDIENVPEEQFALLANRYGVSREAILRRFLEKDLIGAAFYEKMAKQWTSQKKDSKGGDWFASQNIYLSEKFAREVISRHYRQQITMEQASDLLGIKAKNFTGLEERILHGISI